MQILEKIAFPNVPCSYDGETKYLDFVTRSDHRIPIRYYNGNYKFTMIICNGNAEDIGHSDPHEISKRFRVNVCLFDYAGYGLHSDSTASVDSCERDVLAVYNHIIDVKGVHPENIIIYGRSLGSYVACYLCHYLYHKDLNTDISRRKLILISPLMSAVKLVTNIYSPIDILMNYKLAPDIEHTTLIIHGYQDRIVSHTCGYELSKLFHNLYNFVTLMNIGHNDIIFDSSYNDSILEFITTSQ